MWSALWKKIGWRLYDKSNRRMVKNKYIFFGKIHIGKTMRTTMETTVF
jgi:hypothetical protein